MEVIMALDIEDMDMVMVWEATAMLTTTARDLLRPNPKLMPDICMEVMDMAATDVDTDMVLEDMEDTMVLDTGATVMVCGEDKYFANFPLRAFIQKLPITNYLFKDFSSTDKESVPHICGE